MSTSVRIFVLDSIMEVGMLMSFEAAHVHIVPNTSQGSHVRYGDFIARCQANVKCHWQGLRVRVGRSIALGTFFWTAPCPPHLPSLPFVYQLQDYWP